MATVGVWASPTTAIANAEQPSVIVEGNAKILSGTVVKMWYSLGANGLGGLSYAESSDGVNFTPFASNPVIATPTSWSRVFQDPSTGIYYCYTSPSATFPPTQIDVWTSPAGDGLNWTKVNSGAITVGGAGSWDSAVVIQLNVAGKIGSTWYGYYAATNATPLTTNQWAMGQVTSTDLIHWTKSPSNPAITAGGPSNFCWKQIGSVIYGWSQILLAGIPNFNGAEPSDITRYSSNSPAGPFAMLSVPTFYRTLASEGIGFFKGQVADPAILEFSGSSFLYYTASPDGIAANNYNIHVAKATGVTLAQLVQTYEGIQNIPTPTAAGLALNLQQLASDTFARADANPIGGNWTTLTSFSNAQIVSNAVEGTANTNCDSFYNAIVWPNDQWSQTTLVSIAGGFFGADVRMASAASSAYRPNWNGTSGGSGTLNFSKRVAGTNSSLGSITDTFNNGDTLLITAIGSQISVYHNNFLMMTATDAALASGNAGLLINPGSATLANARLNNWSGGGLVNAPPVPGGGTPGGYGPISPSAGNPPGAYGQKDFVAGGTPNGAYGPPPTTGSGTPPGGYNIV